MIYYLVRMLLRQSPVLLVFLGGALFAIIRWKQHPRVSLMTLLAFGIYVVEAIVFRSVLLFVPRLIQEARLSSYGIRNVYTILDLLNSFSYAAIIILLVAAALSRRRPAIAINK